MRNIKIIIIIIIIIMIIIKKQNGWHSLPYRIALYKA